MPYKTGIRLLGVARNPANGFPARLLAPTQEVDALGYRLMICGSTIWLVYQQIRDAFSELKETGQVNPERYGTRWDVAGLLGLDQIYELERKYGSSSIPVA